MEVFEMVKKKTVSAEPTISNIPIPVSDNPMVIDLPDGQKIILGKINPGSVIEVATWRGTGRPDSRTNRFMLGVSDPAAVAAPQAVPDVAANKAINKLQALWKGQRMGKPRVDNQINQEHSQKKEAPRFISRFVGGTVGSVSKALKRTKDLTPIETTQDFDINAWIQNISREAEVKVARKSARQATNPPKKASPVKKAASKRKN